MKNATLGSISIIALLLGLCAPADATIYVNSGTVGTGPYYLDVPGQTYILTEDITTPGSAFVFAAEHVTLDLNQHTVTFGTSAHTYRYGVVMPPPYPHTHDRWQDSDINVWNPTTGAITKNGSVVQGGQGARNVAVMGYEQGNLTVEGVSVVIQGDDTHGMLLDECHDLHILGNTITDNTTVISNRHEGRAAIDILAARDGMIDVHDNTIHNCRQWGIRVKRRTPATVWAQVHHNTIYANTIVTNGYSIGIYGNRVAAYENTINASNGRGVHIELCDESRVYNNQIEVIEQPYWNEYDRLSAHGIKLEDCSRAEVYGNEVVSKGLANTMDAVSNGAALVIGVAEGSNNWVHDNTFIARHLGGNAFNPEDYGMYATALEVVGIEEGSGLVIEDISFVTQDRFLTVTIWRGPRYPDEPIDASGVIIRRNSWSRELGLVPTEKYDLFFGDACVTGIQFIDNNGGDFENFGAGWPWLSCSWGVGYSGTIRAEGGGSDLFRGVDSIGCAPSVSKDDRSDRGIPGTVIQVRDQFGELVTTVTTGISGEVVVNLDALVLQTAGAGIDQVVKVYEPNPYRFTAITTGSPDWSRVASVKPGWMVPLRVPFTLD